MQSDDEQLRLDGADEGELRVEAPAGGITLDKNDRSLAEFHRWFQKGKVVVDPEWQRRYVWDRKRASRLIESFLIDLPVPVVYLAADGTGKYEVIDGLQRLTSVFDFFENKYELASLEIRSELNGKRFSDLPTEMQSKLEDTTLRTFELSRPTAKDMMFVIFERLNTGGMALNEMEIRNCLYRGGLNSLLRELADYPEFRQCVNQMGLERRMDDRALVLRFLAFYQMTYRKARKGLKAYFNEFFDTYRNPNPEKLKEFETQFKHAMKAAKTVFGDRAFRLRRDNKASTGGGEWAARVNGSILQVITVSFTDYDLSQITRAADRIYEAYCELVQTDERWVEAVTKSTGDYGHIEYAFETWNRILRDAIGDERANDGQRTFSRELKQELFESDPTCALCGQEIKLMNDAALDHIEQYWRGGRTVPDNARLVHRLCNLKRPRSA